MDPSVACVGRLRDWRRLLVYNRLRIRASPPSSSAPRQLVAKGWGGASALREGWWLGGSNFLLSPNPPNAARKREETT